VAIVAACNPIIVPKPAASFITGVPPTIFATLIPPAHPSADDWAPTRLLRASKGKPILKLGVLILTFVPLLL